MNIRRLLGLIFFIGCSSEMSADFNESSHKEANRVKLSKQTSLTQLSISNVTPLGLDVSVNYTGDKNLNATAQIHFCNETKNPSCDPLNNTPTALSKTSGSYSQSISNLQYTNDTYDNLNYTIVVSDSDGVNNNSINLTGSLALNQEKTSDDAYLSQTSLIAWYKFNNSSYNDATSATIIDYSTNSAAGTLTTLEAAVEKVSSGMLGNALSFDGVDDVVNITNTTPFEITNDQLTIMGWIKRTGAGQWDYSRIFSKSDGGFSDDYAIFLGRLNNRISFRVVTADTTLYELSGPFVPLNDWVHFAGVYDGSMMRIYFNGYEMNREAVTGNIRQSSSSVSIGAHADTPANRRFIGEVDELTVWNRALSSEEIKVTYDLQDVALRSVTQIYRSVGPQNTSILEAPTSPGGNSLTITSGVANFQNSLSNLNIGVGDAIEYDSNNNGSINEIMFIEKRLSGQRFVVQNIDGSTPADMNTADSDWVIRRAYTSLANAENAIENTSISYANFDTWTDGKDLVTNNEILNLAVYKDNVETTNVDFSGGNWNTGVRNYINVFTPYTQTEVGISQRHTGVAGTGYVMNPNNIVAHAVDIDVPYTQIHGLEITDWYDSGVDGDSTDGIHVSAEGVYIDSVIVHDDGHDSATNSDANGINIGGFPEITAWVNNSIIYNIARIGATTWDNNQASLILSNSILYNCNINDGVDNYGCITLDGTIASESFMMNNFSQTLNYGGAAKDFDFYNSARFRAASENNVSADGSAIGKFNSQNITATDIMGSSGGVFFTNLSTGSESFIPLPLTNSTLYGQGEAFGKNKNDITGKPRNGRWDIGAFNLDL